MNSRDPHSRSLVAWLAVAVGAVTALCFLSTTTHDFVNVDDVQYVLENPHVNHGLNWTDASWAFRTGYACNWHPVTWLSHMIDCSLFGLRPFGHHLTNVLIHSMNAALVFLLISRLTGAPWRSLIVAGLFAWHPLRVESVAWVAERKDVLSAWFVLLTLLAYVRYTHATERSATARGLYLLALLLFALALMSKPMAVTLPGVLLLLDYWPLRRFSDRVPGKWFPRTRLLVEKVPFAAMSLGACVATYVAQRSGGAVSATTAIPVSFRLANAAIGYVRYLWLTVWPAKLAPIYPLPLHYGWWPAAGALLLLGLITLLVVRRARQVPAAGVGWFWFLGTLVPVIGLIQVGPQALADRYTYLPSIGLFFALVWVAAEFGSARPALLRPLVGGGAVALGLSVACTQLQLKYWSDGLTLYAHAAECVPDNYVAYDYLATALHRAGRNADAKAALAASLRLRPKYPEAQYNLGTILLEEADLEGAVRHLSLAVELAPEDGNAQQNLGSAFLKLGAADEAAKRLQLAVRLKPEDWSAWHALGTAQLRQSNWPEAGHCFAEAVRFRPGWAEAHQNLAVALVQQGQAAEAIREFAEAVRLEPQDAELRFNLGLALVENGHPAEAVAQLSESVRLQPGETKSHFRLARAFVALHRWLEAAEQYREVVRLNPDFSEARNELAWLLATCPDDRVRNGAEAARLAAPGCTASTPPEAGAWIAMAAAYAENGQFAESTQAARRAREAAVAAREPTTIARAEAVLHASEAGQRFRE